MTANLQRALEVLREELGLPAPAAPSPALTVDGCELRVAELPRGQAVLLGVLGFLDTLAQNRRESPDNLLRRSLTLHGARFAKLGTPEALTLDEGKLVLWSRFDAGEVTVPAFLQTAESMLNEVEFWKNWLAAA